jgi:hypothetical protein
MAAFNWLNLVQVAAQLVPLLAPGDPNLSKVTNIVSEAAQGASIVIAGFQPPRDIASVEADFELIVQNLPPEVGSTVAVQEILKGFKNSAAVVADLNGGQAVSLLPAFALPGFESKKFVLTLEEVGGPAYDSLYGGGGG